MQTRPKSAIKLLEPDLPKLKPNKPLKGHLVRSNSPTLTQRMRWRRTESFKHIDLDDLETLICVRSKTPTVLDNTPRLRKTSRSSVGFTRIKRNSSTRMLPERKYSYANKYQRDPVLQYDSVREKHFYISQFEEKEQPKTVVKEHKPLRRIAGKLTRKSTPLGKNNIFYRTHQANTTKSFTDLRPSVSKSRLFKLI
mmetsp:Transcript_9543/g.18582  ORF Transcript_9543/g.18582 Transcript_9543/m.18582 type:complete len:196 (+) Transcript_9543:2686-3273(+)